MIFKWFLKDIKQTWVAWTMVKYWFIYSHDYQYYNILVIMTFGLTPNFFELPHDIFHMPFFFHSIWFIKKKSIELFKINTIIQSQFYNGSYDLSTWFILVFNDFYDQCMNICYLAFIYVNGSHLQYFFPLIFTSTYNHFFFH